MCGGNQLLPSVAVSFAPNDWLMIMILGPEDVALNDNEEMDSKIFLLSENIQEVCLI